MIVTWFISSSKLKVYKIKILKVMIGWNLWNWFYQPGAACLLILLVFLSWSLIFFSISASVSTWILGPHSSASARVLTGNLIWGSGDSLKGKVVIHINQEYDNTHLKAYVLACQLNWPLILYAMVVTNSPPKPRSEQSCFAKSSGLFSGFERSHSNWSTNDMFPTWIFNCRKWYNRCSEVKTLWCGLRSICS